MVHPHAEADESGRDVGQHQRGVAERLPPAERRQDRRDEAHRREEDDVDLRVREEPEEVLPEERIAPLRLVEEVGADLGHPVGRQDRARQHHGRHGEEDHERRHHLRPDEQRPSNQSVYVMGDFGLLESEMNPVLKVLTDAGWTVTGIHNHMILESPKTTFMHWETQGDLNTIVGQIKNALAETSIQGPK